jgi:hypothetical protein
MASSTISEEMIKNFVQLNADEQKSLLQMVKIFLNNKKRNTEPQSLAEYNAEIKAALKAAKKGAVTSVEQLEAEMKFW